MALATYDDLVAQVQAWSKRNDLGAQAPDFVKLAETRIKELAHPKMLERTVIIHTVIGSDYVPLPSGFEPIAFWIGEGGGRREILQLMVEDLPYSTDPAKPYYYGIDGDVIRFPAPVDAVYPLQYRYSPMYSISASQQTNEILTKYPDIYLFATLFESSNYQFDDESAIRWDARFRDAIKRANRQEARADKNVKLVTEISKGRSYNIYEGQ
ncbi:hypothetical protein AVMA1855_20030 [Acidovorax sp. SUPP1855]|uniref:phage adaptor protein n=1 Tax=Acidovorax sp. SUPP1855 TaxID=431774 RepID=UPI0023DE2EF5|nr:hypothetical protein [Acidovorax sp. SUPP1855]GKS86480.1 hypothetical protein AVMA1855_20030 [Acidovorax sp. SUPP1855]